MPGDGSGISAELGDKRPYTSTQYPETDLVSTQSPVEKGPDPIASIKVVVHEYWISTICGLVVFSMLGVLIRTQLNDLFEYPGSPVYHLIWSQMFGCFIMGAITKLKGPLTYISPSLFVGLGTGLCGSITTFSSWQEGIYAEFFNVSRDDHVRFKYFIGGVSVFVTTVCASVAADESGRHLGSFLRPIFDRVLLNSDIRDATDREQIENGALKPPAEAVTTCKRLECITTRDLNVTKVFSLSSIRIKDQLKAVDWLLVVSATLAVTAVVIVIALAPSTRFVSWALLFGPPGAISRWYLSRLNTRVRNFPLGTFVANWTGSTLLSIWWVLQNGGIVQPSAMSCSILQGLSDGMCGCLTTISTFVVELKLMRPLYLYRYLFVSFITSQAVWILMAGIYFKTSTIDYPTCLSPLSP